MVFFDQLLHMFGRRAASTGFIHAATGHQGHDGEHLGRGAQFHDGEQVGQVVAQDVAGGADGVQATNDTFQGVTHGTHLAHDLDVQTRGVVLMQVHLDLGDQLRFVRAILVEPEHHGHAGVAGAVDGQLDPVTNGGVLDLAHAPDVAFFHVLGQKNFSSVQVGDVGHAVFGNLESLVVRAVFLGLLSHQADVGHGTHGLGVERAVPLAEVDHLLIDTGEGRFGHHGLDVFQAAVSIPHLAAVADHGGHGRVHDHVVGRVEVGDAFGGVDHRQLRAVFVASVQVALDFVLQRLGQGSDLVVQIDHAVVHVHAQLVAQHSFVLFKGFFVEDLDAVTEHDGVRHLHHGGFHVQREHHAGFACVFNFFLVERQQCFFAHEHAVDHFAVQQRHLLLEHNGFAGLGDELHLHIASTIQSHGFFAVIEVARVHV